MVSVGLKKNLLYINETYGSINFEQMHHFVAKYYSTNKNKK